MLSKGSALANLVVADYFTQRVKAVEEHLCAFIVNSYLRLLLDVDPACLSDTLDNSLGVINVGVILAL